MIKNRNETSAAMDKALKNLEQAKKDLARIKAETKTEELNNSATKTATTAASSWPT